MVDMNRTLPSLVALLVTAVGCECQEQVIRRAPVERIELVATGLLDDGDPTTEIDYNPPVYRIRAHDGGGYSASMTLGWGAVEELLPDSPEARDLTRLASNGGDAFALVMERGGMSDLAVERTVLDEDFAAMRFTARLGDVRYADHAPRVEFAIDLATGAIRAEVRGTLVSDDKAATARSYHVSFDAVGKVQCWGAGQTMDEPPEWDSEFPGASGPCADLRARLHTLDPVPETPAPPWSLDDDGGYTCGPVG